MPRYPRKYIETSYIHIMTQGINKNYIFDKSEDIKYYIKIIYELRTEYNIKIIAYCIMNNHAHILVEIKDINDLSKYMQRINTKYGKYYNKKYNRVGFVFRNRYKSEGIYNDKHLYNCINYIYENPVRAGICKKASEYAYSNYKKINIKIEGDYNFIEIDEEKDINYKKEIEDFYKFNNIEDIMKLKKLIKLLKNKYKVSIRQMSKDLNINREKIRKLYNE